jgi:ABC-type Fe3+-hydroxamate transport system substrate-binding protein
LYRQVEWIQWIREYGDASFRRKKMKKLKERKIKRKIKIKEGIEKNENKCKVKT